MEISQILALPILLAFLASLSHGADDLDIVSSCLNETGVTHEMATNYKPTDGKPGEELLCFIKCNFEKMGYLKEDGTVCVETMKKNKFPEGTDEMREKVYECIKKLPKMETCDDAWLYEECFTENN